MCCICCSMTQRGALSQNFQLLGTADAWPFHFVLRRIIFMSGHVGTLHGQERWQLQRYRFVAAKVEVMLKSVNWKQDKC